MRKLKRKLAALLAAVMLLSLLPATALAEEPPDNLDTTLAEELPDGQTSASPYTLNGIGAWIGGQYVTATPTEDLWVDEDEYGIAPASLLPLTEYRYNLDFSEYLPEELKSVTLETLWNSPSGGSMQARPEGAKIMWTKTDSYSGSQSTNDDFRPLGEGEALDLRPEREYASYLYLQLIVGPAAADQLDPSNVRYVIRITLPHLDDLFAFEAETASGNAISILDTYSNTTYPTYYRLMVGHSQPKDEATLHIKLNDSRNVWGVTLEATYPGIYETAEDAKASGAKDISASGYFANYFDYPYQYFTAVLKKGEITQIATFYVRMVQAGIQIDFSPYYDIVDSQGDSVCYDYDWDYNSNPHTDIIILKDGLAVDGTYYVKMTADDDESSKTGIDCVEKAVVGLYSTLDEVQAQTDIKNALFGGVGYGADYSKGVELTVFDIYGDPWQFRIQTVAYEHQDIPSTTTYFKVNGSYKTADTYSSRYNSYAIMDGNIDSMQDTYQTVFLLDGENPVEAGTIFPTFSTGSGVSVFLGLDQTSGEKQESGKSEVLFESGKALEYSAAAEDMEHVQNYWVTFLTQQSGPKLFVNGENVKDSNYNEEENIPGREIHLGDLDYLNVLDYDILFANIGDEALEDLYVKLEQAEGSEYLALDPYWTITETGVKSLAAFMTTSKRTTEGISVSYGELPNLGKVRLVPVYDEDGRVEHGVVDGYLVIGSASSGDEVKIKLTGLTGIPSITTETVNPGVKYVPYDQLIQSNNAGDPGAVHFELDPSGGALPAGIELYSDGELYGVPLVEGEFTFKVNLVTAGGAVIDTKEFTLTIELNTDDNVWNASDTNYSVLDYIGDPRDAYADGQEDELDGSEHYVLTSYTNQVFRSEGEYMYFVAFYLDGEKLTEGVDYSSNEGSTVITIFAETFQNAGTGTHTIAAEFFEKDNASGSSKPDGTLKRTAQNYTVDLSQNNNNNNSGSNGNSGGSTDNSSQASQPSQPSESQTPSALPFTDVLPQHWFYEDVKWAYDEGWMVGVSDTLFAPDSMVSQAIIVTVLARMQNIDLTRYDGISYEGIPTGMWYTNAAIWAKQAGLLSDTVFTEDAPTPRSQMAVMLVKYMQSIGVDTSLSMTTVTFDDADQMTQAENDAFQVLYHYHIFKGVGGLQMQPEGTTSRAQFAALIHRINDFVKTR